METAETTEQDRGAHAGEAEFHLNPKIQDSIGRSLKAHYDDIVNSPVPDKFLVLLAQLEAREQRDAAGELSDERN